MSINNKGISMKIIKNIVFVFIVFFFCFSNSHSIAQSNKKRILFPMVEIPDTVRTIIAEFLKREEKLDTTFTAFYIYNYANPKDYKLKNGVYTFRLMGPHFRSRLMIYSNGKIKLFRNSNVICLLEEFIQFVRSININDKEKTSYLNLICKFLHEENNKNYLEEQ